MATVIDKEDFIVSVADSLQFMSCYHPLDFIHAVHRAWQQEESPAARDALAQILMNSRMSAEGRRPVCQDTGIVVAFVKVGMDVQWRTDISIAEMVDEGVRRAYTDPDNTLRASIVADPDGKRINTRDNSPAVVHTEIVPGDTVSVQLAAKGGGSENKARLAMLNPSDSIVDWITEVVPTLGAGWCPPGILGIGIGGTAEKAMVMSKEALLAPIDIQELRNRGPQSREEELRLEIMDAVNALGIGAQGLGGLTTVLDVKILSYPTHAASKPVGLTPNCAATRHAHFTLRGDGPALQTPPSVSDWPDVTWRPGGDAGKVDLDQLTRTEIETWQPGQTLLLSGKLLTGRDAAHRRIQELIESGQGLPDGVDLAGRLLYYVGPVSPVRDEVVGPAGPTTATRMDKFTDFILEHTGLFGMIGKAERGKTGLDALKKHRAVYLVAVGGAAYLVSKAITSARVVAFEEMGMEAIYEFIVKDMPVTVAVDYQGNSVHEQGPALWKQLIAERAEPVTVR